MAVLCENKIRLASCKAFVKDEYKLHYENFLLLRVCASFFESFAVFPVNKYMSAVITENIRALMSFTCVFISVFDLCRFFPT